MWYIVGFAVLLVVVWLIAMKLFPHTITLKEGLIMLAVQSVIVGTVVVGSLYGQGYDVQILNGEVTSKNKERVSCSHSYSCNCVTTCSGSGSSRSCSTICQTCYEHSYDIDWDVDSTVGSTTIDRIDRQGVMEPPRWSTVRVGEPFAMESSYYNYIKASPFSIFNKSQIEDKTVVPAYLSVYDYYRVNRVIDFESKFKHDSQLNTLLNESLRKLGPSKKVNIVVVLHNKGSFFSEAMRAKQLGGKINDVYVVIDIDEKGVFNSVAVFSWSKTDEVNVLLRDALLDLNHYEPVAMNQVISHNIQKYYQHRSIEEFKYLDEEVEIPKAVVWFLMIFGMLFPFGAAYIAHRYEM